MVSAPSARAPNLRVVLRVAPIVAEESGYFTTDRARCTGHLPHAKEHAPGIIRETEITPSARCQCSDPIRRFDW